MKTGEVIRGRVSAVRKGTKNWFFVMNERQKPRPIDLNTVDEWLYDG